MLYGPGDVKLLMNLPAKPLPAISIPKSHVDTNYHVGDGTMKHKRPLPVSNPPGLRLGHGAWRANDA